MAMATTTTRRRGPLLRGVDVVEFSEHILDLALSPGQRAVLGGFYGLALGPEERGLFRQMAGYDHDPRRAYDTLVSVAGARSGKSERLTCAPAVYEALATDHARYLSRGERAIVPIVAQDMRAVHVCFGYLKGMLCETPELAGFVDEVKADRIDLANRCSLLVLPSTASAPRGYTIPAACLDELAFWDATTDRDVLRGVKRGMASVPRPRLFLASTPYAKAGLLWSLYERHWGKPGGKVLVVHAPTRLLNPRIDAARLAAEEAEDPTLVLREFEAQWLSHEATFLPEEVLQAATRADGALPPQPGVRYSKGFDPGLGGAKERTAWAVGHRDGATVVIDLVGSYGGTGRPYNPADAVAAACADFAAYGNGPVAGDASGGGSAPQRRRRRRRRCTSRGSRTPTWIVP